MGRPLNSKFFGLPTLPGVSIQFTSCWIPGENVAVNNAYIVQQTGTNTYLAENPLTAVRGHVTLSPTVTAAGMATIAVTTSGQGGGTGAVLTALLGATSGTKGAGGTGNVVGDSLTVTGGTGAAAVFTVSSVDGNGGVTGLSVKTAGSYSALPTGASATTSSGAGTGATITINTYKVVGFSSSNPGGGYVNPSLSLPGGATGTPVVSNGAITGGTVTNGADNYTAIPTVTISDTGPVEHAKKITSVRVLTFEGNDYSWKADSTTPDATYAKLPLV